MGVKPKARGPKTTRKCVQSGPLDKFSACCAVDSRNVRQSSGGNGFDGEISDKQEIASLISPITRDDSVMSKSWLRECVLHAESKPWIKGRGGSQLCWWAQSNSMPFHGNQFGFFYLPRSLSCFTSNPSQRFFPEKSQFPFPTVGLPDSGRLEMLLHLSSPLLRSGLKSSVWNDIWSD